MSPPEAYRIHMGTSPDMRRDYTPDAPGASPVCRGDWRHGVRKIQSAGARLWTGCGAAPGLCGAVDGGVPVLVRRSPGEVPMWIAQPSGIEALMAGKQVLPGWCFVPGVSLLAVQVSFCSNCFRGLPRPPAQGAGARKPPVTVDNSPSTPSGCVGWPCSCASGTGWQRPGGPLGRWQSPGRACGPN